MIPLRDTIIMNSTLNSLFLSCFVGTPKQIFNSWCQHCCLLMTAVCIEITFQFLNPKDFFWGGGVEAVIRHSEQVKLVVRQALSSLNQLTAMEEATLRWRCLPLVFMISVSAFESRKGYFSEVDTQKVLAPSTMELESLQVPSDLACSQRCFANEFCSYKFFHSTSGTCSLYQRISSTDAIKLKEISKKVNVSCYLFH